jgi:CheY-like chemotaxis protein
MDRTYCSLLVVDDDEANRDLLSRRLSREGYNVAVARDGKGAFEILESETFDLILLDILMPDIDGIEVLRQIRSCPPFMNVPVMMVTALSDRGYVMKCIELGANDYITKPFDMLLVKSRVWRCLEGGSYCEIRHDDLRNSQRSQVLVVDDNGVNADLLCRRVDKLGHQPVVARHGREALDILRRQDVDLVLLDIQMPVMDGLQVLAAMKADTDLKQLPVIMISAISDDETIHQCLELGADDYITKPYNATLLQARVNPLIKIKKKADLERSKRRRLEELAKIRSSVK